MAATCLVALSLPPCTWSRTGVRLTDPWDVPEGGEEVEAAPAEAEMDPNDEAQRVLQFQRASAERRAKKQHAVMSQFMKKFARNMRLSVLEDSRGDMPEEQRQRLIAQAEAQQQAENGEGGGFGGGGGEEAPPPEAEEMAPPPPPRRRLPRRMLNMAEARHQRMAHRRPKLLPEAEGIGFPPPEGMAESPQADEAPLADEAPPAPRPRRRHSHPRMLNMRPGAHAKKGHGHHHRGEDKDAGASGGESELPPGVVRDDMGRAMPLLFTGSSPGKGAHSGSFHAAIAPLAVLLAAFAALVRL